MVACSEDITTCRPDSDKRYISFSVRDDNVTSQNSSTRACVSPWATEKDAQLTEEKVVAVETDFPTEEPLCLTISDEPFIRHDNTDVTRGTLFDRSDAHNLVFGVTEFLTSNPSAPVFSNTIPVYQNTTLDDGRKLFKANEFWEYDAYDGINYDFYAYAPHVDGTAHGITLSNNNRTITYNAAGVAVGNQPDLMTARKWTSSYVGAIPLTFQHRLCAIQIKTRGTWAAGYHVSAVKFTNVISSGTFNIDTDKGEAWTSKGDAGDYVVSGFNEADATETFITGPDDKWLMMVPQSLNGSKFSITLTDASSNSYIVTAPINASTWTAGHTVTYTVSPESFTDFTVNYPSGSDRNWNDNGNAVPGPVSTYATTDQFGLFVLNKDNKILISNLLVTPTTGSDAATRTLNIPATVFKSKQYKYFLMYPYKSDATLQSIVGTADYNSYYAKGVTVTGRTANADAFFSNVVTNWPVSGSQSTEANFKLQDLQIASLSGNQFEMVHKMGLAQMTMNTSEVWRKRITYVNESNSVGYSPEKVTVPASTNFATNIPYLYDSKYYFIVKGSATFSTSATGIRKWVGFTLSPAAGALAKQTITPTATYTSNHFYFDTKAYSFKNSVQTMTVTQGRKYFYEVWGACGGGYGSHRHPEGGYSCGYKTLTGSGTQTIYIVTGGRGKCCYNTNDPARHHYDTTGSYESYNGGGKNLEYSISASPAGASGASAGGATHIGLKTGLLTAFKSDYSTNLIVVAGGGGCNGGSYKLIEPSPYSVGGGTNGADCVYGNSITALVGARGGTRGTQGAVKGSFGQGGSANASSMGSGGGGFMGGNSGIDSACPGGGGSAYIGGLDASGRYTYDGNTEVPAPGGGTQHGNGYTSTTGGHGYAMISLCPIED